MDDEIVVVLQIENETHYEYTTVARNSRAIIYCGDNLAYDMISSGICKYEADVKGCQFLDN
jgi:hypothetical protein